MLARASTKTFVSRVQKTAKKSSLARSLVSRGITVFGSRLIVTCSRYSAIIAHIYPGDIWFELRRSLSRQDLLHVAQRLQANALIFVVR